MIENTKHIENNIAEEQIISGNCKSLKQCRHCNQKGHTKITHNDCLKNPKNIQEPVTNVDVVDVNNEPVRFFFYC